MSAVRWIIDDGVIRARLDDPTTILAGPELARARTTLAQPLVTLLLESRSPSAHTIAVIRIGDVVVGVSSGVPTPGGPGSALRRAAPVIEVSIAPMTRCLDEIMRLIPLPDQAEGGSVALSLRRAAGGDWLAALWLVADGHYLLLRPEAGGPHEEMNRAQVSRLVLTELASALVEGLDKGDLDPDELDPDGELDPDELVLGLDDEWAGRPGAVSA